jgi:hypothetical protein
VTPRALAVAVAVLWAARAEAYVRTAAEGTGAPLAWPLPAIPYHVNRSFAGSSPSCLPSAAGDPVLDAIRKGFTAWEQPCDGLRLLYGGDLDEQRVGTAGSRDNLVVIRRGWCSQRPEVVADPCYSDWNADCGSKYGCFEDHAVCTGQPGCATRSVVALTSVLYDPADGRILNADIELNAWDGTLATSGTPFATPPANGWYFTCATPPDAQGCQDRGDCCTRYGQDGCYGIDLQNTVTHEVGHVLGLAHSDVQGATMAATTGAGEISKRTLAPDDLAGICAVYQVRNGGCACGAGGGAGAVSLLVAALALRPRRRRGAGLRTR